MQLPSFRISACVPFIVFIFSFQSADAQRLQLQLQLGINFSEAYVQDNGQVSRETSTYWDTMPGTQFGLALNARVYKNFRLRLDGNYRAYRTSFNIAYPEGNNPRYILGNLYSEKFSFSVLPEYRMRLNKSVQVPLVGYLFAGPVLSFERKNNYATQYVIGGGGSVDRPVEIKPDPQSGWCFGGGINPRWDRWGLLLEARYTRFAYAEEGLAIGEMAYGHFTFVIGASVDLVK